MRRLATVSLMIGSVLGLLLLSVPAVAQTATPAATTPPKGPLPTTKADAERWLAAQKLGTAPEALAFYLTLGEGPISADVVRAYLLVGAPVKTPLPVADDHALNTLASAAAFRCGPGAAEAAGVLLKAGASPNTMESGGRKASVTMGAVFCPEMLKEVLAAKPDLNAVDAMNNTAMYYALMEGKKTETSARLLMAAGFDLKRWRPELAKYFSADTLRSLEAAAPTRPKP